MGPFMITAERRRAPTDRNERERDARGGDGGERNEERDTQAEGDSTAREHDGGMRGQEWRSGRAMMRAFLVQSAATQVRRSKQG